ncbi:hypothetical protein KSS87_015368 [Heliosperma pusillum]|nr:hypothetical protein KSS87_016205 [Heliosperma pusillum]KAH9619131.1 hypothetical protein KSS87_015368 [Heliosperma pusillum]
MASWISSKLKVAENLLQQIDQQAAESLRHGDRKSSDDLDFVSSPKLSNTVPLKDQFKKKDAANKMTIDSSSAAPPPKIASIHKLESNSKSPSTSDTFNDTDWTQLLSTPTKPIPSSSRRIVGNLARGRKPRNETKPALVTAPDSTNTVISPVGDPQNIAVGNNQDVSNNGKGLLDAVDYVSEALKNPSPVSDSTSHSDSDSGSGSTSSSNSEAERERQEMIQKRSQILAAKVSQAIKEQENVVARLEGEKLSLEWILEDRATQAHHEASKLQSTMIETMEAADLEKQKHNQTRMEVLARLAKLETANADIAKSLANAQWNLEMEVNNVAELRLLVDAKELVHEGGFVRFESATYVFMRFTGSGNLEEVKHWGNVGDSALNVDESFENLVSQSVIQHTIVTVGYVQVATMTGISFELKRRIYTAHQTRTSLTSVRRLKLTPYKGFELEREMLEDEVSFMTDKTAQLQEKATKLERDIDVILKEMGSPTEVEVELKRRLHQLTDHLIQKQTQVEALSSEKATLLFRIEAVVRLLDENKSQINGGYISGSSREGLEGETYVSNGPKLRMLEHKIQSGKQHLGSVIRQLDVVFYAGAQFLARNPAAKIWSLVYLVCLHLWVLYIVFSHSQSTENSLSSSIVSLENINNNIGG